jgi:hypothetical protein
MKVGVIIFAGFCIFASGCSYRQAYINDQEEHLMSDDKAEVFSTQDTYDASVLASGLYSGETKTAGTDLFDAKRKLEIDQRQFDNYMSASGQSSVPRE